MDKNIVEYINRYKDKIIFTLIDANTIKMEGGKWCRTGWETDEQFENKQFTMVDPSGGPYITTGNNMKSFNKDWDYIVDYITPIKESLDECSYYIKLKPNG